MYQVFVPDEDSRGHDYLLSCIYVRFLDGSAGLFGRMAIMKKFYKQRYLFPVISSPSNFSRLVLSLYSRLS